MKRLSFLASFGWTWAILALSTDRSFAQVVQFAKTFGGSDYDYAYSVQQTIDGGYIVAGGTWSFGAGLYDIILLKLDGSGNVQWAKTFGGSSDDYANSVRQTTDGGYIVAGETYSFGAGSWDIILLKLDGSGNVQWAKTFGGSDEDVAISVQQTTDGGYILAGYTGSFGAGGGDILLLKLDGSGNVQWAKTFGGFDWDIASSVQQTTDGGYIVAGQTGSFGAGGADIILLKLDGSGNVQWAKTFGGFDWDIAVPVQQTTDGGYIVAGQTGSFGAGLYDIILLKLDGSGNVQWAKTFGGSSDDYAYSVQQTTDGGYIVAGFTASFGAGSADFFLLKTDPNGDIGSCGIVQSIGPTVTTPTPSVTSPSLLVNYPTLAVASPTPTVTSPTLSTSVPCMVSISENNGCLGDVLGVGKGEISVRLNGDFEVKVYDVMGKVIKDVKGRGDLRLSLNRGVYFVEVISKERRINRKVIVR